MNRIMIGLGFVLLSAGLAASPLQVLKDHPLTVEEAVEMAMENNLSLAMENIGQRVKARTRDTAWNVLIPSISASSTLTRFPEEINLNPLMPGPGVNGTLGAAVNFQLVLTPQLWYGYRATVHDFEAGLIGLEKARTELSTNIRQQFYTLLVLEEQIAILEAQLESIDRRYQQARESYEAGFVDEYTLLSAQVNMENFKPQIEASRFGYTQAMMGFKLSLGIDLDSVIIPVGVIEVEPRILEASELITRHIAGRPDLRETLKQIEMLENYRKIQKGDWLPRLILGYSLGSSFGNDPWGDNWFSFDDWNESQESRVLSITLNMQLSELLPFSRTSNSIRETDATVEQLRKALTLAWQAARMEISSSVEQINNSVLSIRAREMNVDLAERAFALAEESYSAGGMSLLDVQEAENALKNARFQLLNEKFNYISALLTLEKALNAPVTGQGVQE